MLHTFDRKEVDREIKEGREVVLYTDVSQFDSNKEVIATLFIPKRRCRNCGGTKNNPRTKTVSDSLKNSDVICNAPFHQ